MAEIERTAEALGSLARQHRVFTGCMAAIEPAAAARRAGRRRKPGTRKLVLASAIAETSLTLDDVRIVVDSGLARRPRYDRGAGLTRLVTERASRAAVTQRAGRAARQAPGIAIRLWEEAATASLPAHDPPEILEADLSQPAADLPAVGRKRPGAPAASSIRRRRRHWPRRGSGWRGSARSMRTAASPPHGRAIAAHPA